MKKAALSFLLAALAAVCACAQSAEKISEIVDASALTYGQGAYLALAYSGDVAEGASYQEAVQKAVERGWMQEGADSDSAIKLQALSALYVRASGLSCGLFYRLTQAPRYAFKELKARGLLDKAADPSMTVSGQNAVNLFNACVQKAEGSK